MHWHNIQFSESVLPSDRFNTFKVKLRSHCTYPDLSACDRTETTSSTLQITKKRMYVHT